MGAGRGRDDGGEEKREQAEEDIMFLVAQGADSLGEVLWPRQGKARCLARCVSWLGGHEDGWLRDAQEGGRWQPAIVWPLACTVVLWRFV